jgi:benzodiazapine receptor
MTTRSHSISSNGVTAPRSGLAALAFGALSYGVSAVGAYVMNKRGPADGLWYRSLPKPSFQPPPWVFGPVWTALYGAIAYSGYRVYRAPTSPDRTRALSLWVAQLALNGAWTPIFFGAHKPRIALVDIIALDAAATAYVAAAAKVDKRAAAVVSPYLAWLAFATTLNGSIAAKSAG